jgi:hypothetical protein
VLGPSPDAGSHLPAKFSTARACRLSKSGRGTGLRRWARRQFCQHCRLGRDITVVNVIRRGAGERIITV